MSLGTKLTYFLVTHQFLILIRIGFISYDFLFRGNGDSSPESIYLQEVRQQRPRLDEEVPCHQQRAGREHHIARQAHPLPEQSGIVEGGAAGVGEAMLENGIELRPADGEEIEQDPKHKACIVEPEGPDADLLAERHTLSGRVTQAKIDEPDGEQSER